MRFLVDECAGPVLAQWLRSQSHEVYSVYHDAPGAPDDFILEKAAAERRILITCDRDFGEKIFRHGESHHGVIYLRLRDERPRSKIAALSRLLDAYGEHLAGAFVVVTESRVRFASK